MTWDERLVRNMAQCGLCGDVIESLHHHDYVSCSCQGLWIDGGLLYQRRQVRDGNPWVEMSEWQATPKEARDVLE